MSLDLTGFDTEEQLREGEYNPPEPGIYHVAISEVDAVPVSRSGEALDGIQVTFQVLAGNVDGMAGREFRQLFFYPSPTAKDGGKFASKRLAMLGLATEVIDRSQLGRSVDPNWEDMAARHLVVAVKEGSDPKYREIDGLKMWHVNHPDVADPKKYPKDAEVLAEMPMTWKPAGEPAAPKPAASAPSAPTKAAPKPGAPKPGAKRTAAAANGGDRSTAAAAAAEGGKKNAWDDIDLDK